MESFEKLCPKCHSIINYSSKRSLNNSIRNGSLCKKCNSKKLKKHDAYKCPKCDEKIVFKNKSSLYRAIKNNSACKKCSNSAKALNAWKDEDYRSNITKKSRSLKSDEDFCAQRSKEMADKWNDESYKKHMTDIAKSNTEFFLKNVHSDNAKEKRKKSISEKWSNDKVYRQTIINKLKSYASKSCNIDRSRNAALKQWENDEFRSKMKVVLDNTKKVSSQQEILYTILDDLGVKYFRERNDGSDDKECSIGPYSFDCVIPTGCKNILIEVQGEYWHSQPGNILRDNQKLSYISNNFPNCEVKYIWDHEFLFKDRVVETIKYWLGISSVDYVDFSFNDVAIRKSKSNEYRELLSKYHYLSSAGRGGTAIGAYYLDQLIAVCVFSPMIRQNIDNNAKELSRLCIHPSFQKKNFGSWFIARSLKEIKKTGVSKIISYCDTTYNHDGSVYKASNFVLVGEVKPDYWYVDGDGWVMHKKTLYNRAVNMGMKEKDYAAKHGYTKVWGKNKLKFEKCL